MIKNDSKKISLEDKIKGSLFGFFCGDATGVPL